jgi:GTP-binding protein Era
MTLTPSSEKRCGFVAVMGAPNAGKSTLTNALVGAKVSIVTHKAQTTRRRILGIVCKEQTQMIFVDTPGLFAPRKVFDKAMVESALGGLSDADMGFLLIDVAKGDLAQAKKTLELLPEKHPPLCLVLNKIDLIDKEKLLAISAELNALTHFDRTFMICALKDYGIKEMLTYLEGILPAGPWHYPEDQLSNLNQRQVASEIVREKLFLYLHDEVPYGLTVDTESWETFRDGSAKLTLTIYIDREQHKPIVLGAGGSQIKHIGKLAREELEELWGHRVHLFLSVKVKDKWTQNPGLYRELGLDMADS